MYENPATPAQAVDCVVLGSHALATAGQSDMIWGHCSVRDPQGRGAWMKSAGWGFEEVDGDRVVLVSPGGDVVSGSGRRNVEYPIHTQLLSRLPGTNAVVHTHSDAANSFSALDAPLRPLNHADALFSYPDAPRFTLTGGLIATRELGDALADTLGDAAACLIPQHGLVTIGPDLPTAVMTAVGLDHVCRTVPRRDGCGPARRWGSEADTVAKRSDAWPATSLHGG